MRYFKTGKIRVNIYGQAFVTATDKPRYVRYSKGYKKIRIYFERKYRDFPVHQLVWVWFNGPVPYGYEIDHIDFDKTNNELRNLRLLTPLQNQLHQRGRPFEG